MTQQQNALAHWLQDRQTAALKEADHLAQDNRSDDAALQKIRANIFSVFSSVLQAGAQQDPEHADAFFAARLDSIPSQWQSAHDVATAHGDTKKAVIEEIKLSAAQEIRRQFTGLEAAHD